MDVRSENGMASFLSDETKIRRGDALTVSFPETQDNLGMGKQKGSGLQFRMLEIFDTMPDAGCGGICFRGVARQFRWTNRTGHISVRRAHLNPMREGLILFLDPLPF